MSFTFKKISVLIPFVIALSTAWSQSIVADYGPTRTPRYVILQAELKANRANENIAAVLSTGIRLPTPMTFGTAECGQPNAYYRPQNRLMVLCLETITYVNEGIQRQYGNIMTSDELVKTANMTVLFVLFHELGHALIHNLNLPVLGREEDGADQISAFFMLASNDAVYGLNGVLWFFRSKSLFYSARQVSGEHSLDAQRQANLACWAFGKDPNRYKFVVSSKYLSPERSVRCRSEYEQLDRTVRQLLDGKVDLPPR